MTDEEWQYFHDQMNQAQARNQTDFFFSVMKKRKITVLDGRSEILRELTRMGNNLNQIARQLNERTPFGKEGKAVLNECYAAYRKIQEIGS